MKDSARSALAWGLVWLGLIVLALLLWQMRQIVILAFLALIIAAGLHGPVLFLEKRGLPRIVSLLAAYLGILLVFAGLLWIVIPPLIEELVALFEAAPTLIQSGEDWLREQLRALPGDVGDEGMAQLQEQLGGIAPDMAGLAALPLLLVAGLVNVVLVVFLSALLLLERDRLREGLLAYIQPDRRRQVANVGRSATEKLGAYVRGQLLMMTVIGIGTGIGMLVLGVPYILPLSFLAFLTEAIPIVGPFISGIPIVIIAFTQDTMTGILMAIWVIALQQLEGLVLAPMIQNKALKLSPVVILLGVVAGGTLGGVIGALVAIPIVAVLQVIVTEVVLPMRKQSWGEKTKKPGASKS